MQSAVYAAGKTAWCAASLQLMPPVSSISLLGPGVCRLGYDPGLISAAAAAAAKLLQVTLQVCDASKSQRFDYINGTLRLESEYPFHLSPCFFFINATAAVVCACSASAVVFFLS
jgi:hypothetical protein